MILNIQIFLLHNNVRIFLLQCFAEEYKQLALLLKTQLLSTVSTLPSMPRSAINTILMKSFQSQLKLLQEPTNSIILEDNQETMNTL